MKTARDPRGTRIYLSQDDVPGAPLEQTLRVARAIADNYGYKPTAPMHVAKALGIQPSSGGFRMLTGASIAYGVTAGGYNAEQIALTPLGLRIVRPTIEGDDLLAKREALLRPRVVREFLQKYDSAPVPKSEIAMNVLLDMGVPANRTSDVLDLLLQGAASLGLIQEIKGRKYIDLSGVPLSVGEESADASGADAPERTATLRMPLELTAASIAAPQAASEKSDVRIKRVFITHGKNKALIEPIKKLLSFGELESVVSVQSQTVSQPVPGKVMEEMRGCGAAIIHVADERHLVDAEGNAHVVLNENVLIEIGAAMALYGQRFILVVRDGVKLPSNLQGLLELRYKGETLDMEETVKLMEAINDMKKRPLPAST